MLQDQPRSSRPPTWGSGSRWNLTACTATSRVWVNGHYLGTEPSGYASFRYDITDYLNYGGPNVMAVRADATLPAPTLPKPGRNTIEIVAPPCLSSPSGT